MREWWLRLLRLGAHSRRMATFTVWEILLSSPAADTGWIPRPRGQHRHGVAPGTDTQRKAWGLPIDPWPGRPLNEWAEAWMVAW